MNDDKPYNVRPTPPTAKVRKEAKKNQTNKSSLSYVSFVLTKKGLGLDLGSIFLVVSGRSRREKRFGRVNESGIG
jgi:hypothetical protein